MHGVAGTGVSAQLDLKDLSSTCIIMIMSTVLILLSTLMVRVVNHTGQYY